MAFNYMESEFNKLGSGDTYRIKITGPSGETRWLSISAEALSEVKTILKKHDS